MYAEHSFYVNTWGGTLSVAEFDRYNLRAGYLIDCDGFTCGRVAAMWPTASDEDKAAISTAICAMIDSLAAAARTDGRTLLSETVGKHSVTYAEPVLSEQARLRNVIRPYLCGLMWNGEGLLYRGVKARC